MWKYEKSAVAVGDGVEGVSEDRSDGVGTLNYVQGSGSEGAVLRE